MHFYNAALFFGAAIANPVQLTVRGGPCKDGPLYSVPHCCSVDVLNAAELNCVSPSSAKDVLDLQTSCAVSGGNARCRTIPSAEQGVHCIGL
ncbi:hypothetical protein K4F52_007579 [Lecanicillium sp. MT-2017a]|nr:hypothetical protein K4F52_007579 [Lecanicillium sp. MT-2017a]